MIQLLDCTLRDGAHVNNGNFGYQHITDIASKLSEASIDIVELGFLKDVNYVRDVSYYPYIEDAYRILSNIPPYAGIEYALMARADGYDISKLSECNGKIKYIRIAFYYDFLDGAIKFAKEVRARGYNFTLNLINTPGCTFQELENIIRKSNEIRPDVLTVVDTFGVLYPDDLKVILDKYDAELDSEIKIGLHVHENLSLSFSLAQLFVERMRNKRDIIIDASLMGIGRTPGNLCTEMISDYLNCHYGKKYKPNSIFQSIDADISAIKANIQWGYSPAYFLSARYRVHRSYSEYLLNKRIPLEQMNMLLGFIDKKHSLKFDKTYMDLLIQKYING